MEKTTKLSLSLIWKRIQWQSHKCSTFFRTWKKKTKPTRRSRRGRRRLGDDLEITEKLRKTCTTISASTTHPLLDEGHSTLPITYLLHKDNTDYSKLLLVNYSLQQVVINNLVCSKEPYSVRINTEQTNNYNSFVESRKDKQRGAVVKNNISGTRFYIILNIIEIRIYSTTRDHNPKCSTGILIRSRQSRCTLRYFSYQELFSVTNRKKQYPECSLYSIPSYIHSLHLLETSSLIPMECNTA
ncbi:uncharacterized protein ACNLHF_016882 [Anomaloglossus baeobatrachus]|uniref:uncharacterized protein LOC142302700 n=1 Tax=Anomaloglossus baeobatrachus TaxID=238106 RepID=UPI003F4FF7E5